MTDTARQRHWENAARVEARRGNDLAAVFFAMIAEPNDAEREHSCREHSVGFRRDGRRGLKCGVCNEVLRWVDPEVAS